MATTTKLIASSTMEGPEILSLNKTEENKLQIRITAEVMRFIQEHGYNPLVDKTKIMNNIMKLCPANVIEEEKLKYFEKARKRSRKLANKAGFSYSELTAKVHSKKQYTVKPFERHTRPTLTMELLDKKKAATVEVTA